MKVSWDPAKNRANRKKHGVSFEEAQELFTSGVDYLEIRARWEQGRRHPEGPAIALLRIAARHPRIIRENLGRAA